MEVEEGMEGKALSLRVLVFWSFKEGEQASYIFRSIFNPACQLFNGR